MTYITVTGDKRAGTIHQQVHFKYLFILKNKIVIGLYFLNSFKTILYFDLIYFMVK